VVKGLNIFILLVVALFIGGCTPEADSPQQAKHSVETQVSLPAMPLLHIQPAIYDLGDIKEGEAAIATFIIRNNNDEPIEIVDVQAACGCTAAEPDSYLIPSGSFTQLKVAVDTTAKQQDIKKTVHITDSLGNKAVATLKFNVVDNPHANKVMQSKGIFEGNCASCHFEPLKSVSKGADIYALGCAMCHGVDATGAYAPALLGHTDAEGLSAIIAHGVGKPQMPGFAQENGGPLNPEQMHALVRWLMELPAEKDAKD